MSVLVIPISPYIDDTSAVIWALTKMQRQVDVWFPEDYPAHQSLSLSLNVQGVNLDCNKSNSSFSLSKNYQSVWLRYPFQIGVESTNANPVDASFAAKEADHLIQSLLHIVSPQSLWVNHPNFIKKAALKPLQLIIANEIGFQIPKTLMSNDADEISEFIRGNRGKTVFKAFNAATWDIDGRDCFQAMCTEVSAEDINKSSEICPGIYQEVIHKQYDIRVTIMGKTVFAIKQKNTDASYIDSNLAQMKQKPEISSMQLPIAIQSMCLEFTNRMGLSFGCIDLTLDMNGQYWFFEINPNGQFLGYEELCPELPLLDTFCEFLAVGSHEYVRGSQRAKVKLAEFIKLEKSSVSIAKLQQNKRVPARQVYCDK